MKISGIAHSHTKYSLAVILFQPNDNPNGKKLNQSIHITSPKGHPLRNFQKFNTSKNSKNSTITTGKKAIQLFFYTYTCNI